MSQLKKILKPTSQWESVAPKVGGRYVPGKFLGSAEIAFSDDESATFSITMSYAGMDEGGPNSFTQVIARPPLLPDVRLAIAHQWPGQNLVRRMFSMSGVEISQPLLGEDYLVMAKIPAIAEQILGWQGVADALKEVSVPLKVLIGGSPENLTESSCDEVAICSPGLVTDSCHLGSMVSIMRKILAALQHNHLLR